MLSMTRTTSVLLEQLHESENALAWQELDARYRPVLILLGQRAGLKHSDAEDAAQEALLKFVRYYQQGVYDRSKGRLRAWLAGIARNCILDQHRARAARREKSAEQLPDLPLPETEVEAIWDEACRKTIVAHALDELRQTSRTDARTIDAFEQVAFHNRPAAEVAAEYRMSVDSVYAAKHRCTAQLRKIVERLTAAYELE